MAYYNYPYQSHNQPGRDHDLYGVGSTSAKVTPVDPFKPSVAFSVQKVGGGPCRPNPISYDDVPLPPPTGIPGPSRRNYGESYQPYQPYNPPRPSYYDPGYYPGRPQYDSRTRYPTDAAYGGTPVLPQRRPPSTYGREEARPASPDIHYYAPDYGARVDPTPPPRPHSRVSSAPARPTVPVPVGSEKRSTSPRSPAYSPASSIAHVEFEEAPSTSVLFVPDSPITGASWPIELVVPPRSPVLTTEKRSESTIPQTVPDPSPYESASAGMLILAFLVDTLPRQIYLHLLLKLPSLYFSRVSRIFVEAEVTMGEIKQGIIHDNRHLDIPQGPWWFPEPQSVTPCYQKLQSSWEAFIDSLMKEWKTLNIVSVLLLSAILTVLQLDGAAADPVTRFSALISMICALMSLLFGCMYIIRFGTMRKAYKAAEWAQEAQQTQTGIMWNVWIMLAMPAIWLAWSMISYIVCVMAYVWRTGTTSDETREIMSPNDALAPRIAVSCILCLGLIYFVLIASTLRRYGDLMDQAWQRRIQGWIFNQNAPPIAHVPTYTPLASQPPYSAGYTSRFAENARIPTPSSGRRRSRAPRGKSNLGVPIRNRSISAPAPANVSVIDVEHNSQYSMSYVPRQATIHSSAQEPDEKDEHHCFHDHLTPVTDGQESRADHPTNGDDKSNRPIKRKRFCGLNSGDPEISGASYDKVMPFVSDLEMMRITETEWRDIHLSLEAAWDPFDHEKLEKALNHWNRIIFRSRGGQMRLCQEYGVPWSKYAVYYFDRPTRLPYDPDCFAAIDAVRLDILGYFQSEKSEGKAICRRLSLFAPHLQIDEQYLRTNDEDWRSMISLHDADESTNCAPEQPVHAPGSDIDKLDTPLR